MIKFITRLCSLWAFAAVLNAAELQDIQFAELPGEKAEITLSFDSAPEVPAGFTINKPARVVLDFVGVQNALDQKKYPVEVGGVSSAVVVSGGGRTRLIINLDQVAPYVTSVSGNKLLVEVGGDSAGTVSVGTPTSVEASVAVNAPQGFSPNNVSSSAKAIRNIDFRRGEAGEGKVIVSLSNPNVPVDIEEVAKGIEVRFVGTSIDNALRRKLDVVDFATPVSYLDSGREGDDVVVLIEAEGEYDYLAYQADDEYVVSVKPLTEREIEEKKKAFAYVGDRLSLNFQDIQVRSVLQLIADFTELNLVASDTVSGSITLRLENVPWDQALDIVLKSKGLDKRLIGNVLMVAPAAEIAERERQEIETQKQLQELAPLRTEYLRIRYANARELFTLFIGDREGSQGGSGQNAGTGQQNQNSTGSILSERGQAIVDERTNSIILTDTEEKIAAFKELIERVDIPVQQVMIEARIVIANNDFRKELGVRIAGDAVESSNSGNNVFEFTGELEGLADDELGPSGFFTDADGDGVADAVRDLGTSTLVDLGVAGAAGAFTANWISSNFLLGMELSALQSSGFAEIVSEPKVITGDKQQATIESGTEVPYQEESASGGTTTAFKEAVLKLDVTPQITPDDRIIMDLEIAQDSISEIDTVSGIPVIDVTQLSTQVLVSDGDTVVLGGVYTNELIEGQTKIPLLGDIPFVGRLFRNDIRQEQKREILIFITPKIMANEYVQ